ncbi:uncharacterized protein LOC120636805 [Pararge aegeria]|uniref:uncharacterized protein LOC120636805 n=1 Tax=Pararge aegeria TaxID=116150 RepID=UPI0019CF5257|nr:uncharacterized protein LOC120636805 [Pararge aegeria]
MEQQDWQNGSISKTFFKVDNKNPNFVFAPALTEQHINPNGKQKMKVKLAAQVLSHSVAAGLFAKVSSNHISPDVVVTATLISKIDSIFDALNAESPDLKRGKKFSSNLSKSSGHLELFSELKTFFKNVKFIGACVYPSFGQWVDTNNWGCRKALA